jgi:indolepyruvate ferredoxin oxidoreductase beta subunit
MRRVGEAEEAAMKFDIVLAGVGGQGGLSVSIVIARAAMASGLFVKQSEIHGMSQRGGELFAHLRLSDSPVASPIIPSGAASLILAFEPLEALRYVSFLSRDGAVVASVAPVMNMPNYPAIEAVLNDLRSLPRVTLVDADAIAREAGSVRSANVVLVGAAAKLLPIDPEKLKGAIREVFAGKGESVVEVNLKAFADGRAANP